MKKWDWLLCLLVIALVSSFVNRASAALILYEPFDYPADRFLVNTPSGTPTSATSPAGYLAPNNNTWYGTGVSGNHNPANDGQVTNVDLTIPGLYKPNTTRSLTLGTTGHTMRLSLNTSIGLPNQTAVNRLDLPDPNAGTDGTLQSTDTGGTGYYSIALRVTDITNLNATGGTLLGFNNTVNAQTGNPGTVGAALTIRPKPGGNPGEFQLGILDQAASAFANATYDLVKTYTTGQTIFVVGKYQTIGPYNTGVAPAPTDDIAMLWINPNPSTFGPGNFEPAGGLVNDSLSASSTDIPTNAATNFHTLQSFILRQAAGTVIPVEVIYDELRVGTSWASVTPVPEPNSIALLALAVGGLTAGRRRGRRSQ